MKKKWIWLVLTGGAAGAAVVLYIALSNGSAASESGKRTVEAAAARHDFVANVLATGTVKPKVGARVNVGARTSGKVERLHVGVGDAVARGQELAVIEHKDLEAQVTQKEAQMASTRIQVNAERVRAQAEQARLAAALEQRQAELAVERRRLESISQEREAALAAEKRRLESVRGQRNAELAVAQAQAQESSATLELARKDLKRMQELFDRGMLPEQSRDQAATDVSTAESRDKSARGQTSLARTRRVQEVALQEEAVRLAELALVNDVAVQEETVKKGEAAVAVAERELEASKANAEASIAVLESSLPLLTAELEEMKTRLSYASIRAPIDGVIGSVSTQEGETVAAGFNSPTFVTVVDLSQLQVDAYVDEVDIGKVQAGQAATFVVDAFPDTVFEGKVKTIYPSAILQDNVVYYDVVIDISSDFAGKLRPEMTANVTIAVQARLGVLAVPAKAVRKTAGTVLVTVKGPEGEKAREVEVGMEDAEFVEVAKGLSEGEKVVYEVEQTNGGVQP